MIVAWLFSRLIMEVFYSMYCTVLCCSSFYVRIYDQCVTHMYSYLYETCCPPIHVHSLEQEIDQP